MKIFLKQFSGQTVFLESVDPTRPIVELVNQAYEQRTKAREATLESYIKTIQFLFAARTLDFTKTLADYGIGEQSTLMEVPRSFTMNPDFNWETLSQIDGISQEIILNPYSLNPGCGHVFEKENIKRWVRECFVERQTEATCPACRMNISRDHLLRLFFA